MLRNVVRVCSTLTILATGSVVYLVGEKELRLSGHAVVRFSRTAFTVLKISYDYKKTLWNVDRSSKYYQELQSQVHARSAHRLRDLCFHNAGLYIKVGQHLGSLDYLLPAEYVQALKIFHHDAPKSSLTDIYKVVRDELGKHPAELFLSFDIEPLGTASLAQVHKAVLHNGTTVAVKVQHKDIQDYSSSDVRTMEFLANIVKKLFPEFQFTWLVEETKRNLPLELDFVNEGRNSEKLMENFSKLKFLKVPKVFWDYSTQRILTMEYCDGGYVNDINYMKQHNISSDEVSSKVGRLYSEMIFVQGCIHCDPHPGNILIRKNAQAGHVEIVMLDHGLYQEITREFRVNYSKLWQAIISGDLAGIKECSAKMGVGDQYGLFACMLSARTWETVVSGVENVPLSSNEMQELRNSVGMYLTDISSILNRVPRQLLLILKTNDLLRGIDHQLQTSKASRSFVTMSKCCAEAVAREELRTCGDWVGKIQAYARWSLTSARIALYQISVQDYAVAADLATSIAANLASVIIMSLLIDIS